MKGREINVLIVDDDFLYLHLLEIMFRNIAKNSIFSFTVDRCSSVSEAREFINCSVYYDVIITDINMPKEDGFVLIEELHRIECKSLIIANSANHSVGDRCIDLGCDHFVDKANSFYALPKIIQESFVCV